MWVVQNYPLPLILPHNKNIRRGWNEEIIADVARAVRKRSEERMVVAGTENFYHLFANKPAVLKWYNLTPLMIYSKEEELSIINDMKRMDINLVLKCPPRTPGTTSSMSSVEGLPAL